MLKTCLFGLLNIICFAVGAQTISNRYDTAMLTRLRVEKAMIYVPDTSWLYSHHASVTKFKNKLVVIWSNGMKDEDKPGQRVVFSTSSDFIHWSPPKLLAQPSVYNKDTLNILTAAGFYRLKDTLVAYFGEYSPHKTNTHLWAVTSTDGEHWSRQIDMNVPVNPNHGPEKTMSGRLIISGNFTFPYTDDPKGLSGWAMSSFYPGSLYKEDNPATFYAPAEKEGLPPLCEGSFFQTDDSVLHMLLRVTGNGWQGKLWLTESGNNGKTWSFPTETTFTDNDSKFHFGRLPGGNYYYVGIPDTLHHYARTPLILSTSADGKTFRKSYLIADDKYQMKKEGLYKGGQFGYPHTFLDKGYLYIVVSRQKEAIEIMRFTISRLQ